VTKKRPDIEPEIRGTLLEGRKGGTGLEIMKLSGGRAWIWRVYRDGLVIAGGTETNLHDAVAYGGRRLRRRR